MANETMASYQHFLYQFLSEFNWLDYVAFALYLLAWFGYKRIWNERLKKPSAMSSAMNIVRYQWFDTLSQRDNRITDAQIIRIVQQTAIFFASTSILIIGVLLAGLAKLSANYEFVHAIPMFSMASITEWGFKLLMLVYIFIYAFFKFAWVIRLNKYNAIVVGATPMKRKHDDEMASAKYQSLTQAYVQASADLASIIGFHFTLGMRAYFFALASLGWFIHPLLFILSTLGVIWVIYRRDSLSKASKALQQIVKAEMDYSQLPAQNDSSK